MTQPFDDPIAVLGEVSIPHGGVVGLGPGPTLESAVMAKMVLQENHVLYHCFFNKDHFHKCVFDGSRCDVNIDTSGAATSRIMFLLPTLSAPLPRRSRCDQKTVMPPVVSRRPTGHL